MSDIVKDCEKVDCIHCTIHHNNLADKIDCHFKNISNEELSVRMEKLKYQECEQKGHKYYKIKGLEEKLTEKDKRIEELEAERYLLDSMVTNEIRFRLVCKKNNKCDSCLVGDNCVKWTED